MCCRPFVSYDALSGMGLEKGRESGDFFDRLVCSEACTSFRRIALDTRDEITHIEFLISHATGAY